MLNKKDPVIFALNTFILQYLFQRGNSKVICASDAFVKLLQSQLLRQKILLQLKIQEVKQNAEQTVEIFLQDIIETNQQSKNQKQLFCSS